MHTEKLFTFAHHAAETIPLCQLIKMIQQLKHLLGSPPNYTTALDSHLTHTMQLVLQQKRLPLYY